MGNRASIKDKDSYAERYKQRVLHHLARKATTPGFKLVPGDAAPA